MGLVGNVVWGSMEETLTEHLKDCGKIKGVRVNE
jgi:RNA recognition motif-containing protein